MKERRERRDKSEDNSDTVGDRDEIGGVMERGHRSRRACMRKEEEGHWGTRWV